MADARFRSTEEPRDDYPSQRERTGYGDRYTYSSAREYQAAGMLGEGARDRNETYRNRDSYGSYGNSGWNRDDSARDRSGYRDRDDGRGYGRGDAYASDRNRERSGGYGNQDRADRGDPRGFLDRAGDEIRSWFGDEDAERRRERDMQQSDRDYHDWRSRQVADLDRDYDEYRRENAQKFDHAFGTWRTERQGQRTALQRVQEHMDVVGSDGLHVGTVDKVRGDRIILTKSDSDAGGHHHSIPSRWIDSVDDKVTIRKTADEAKAHWRDEERSGALFGDEDRNRSSATGGQYRTDY